MEHCESSLIHPMPTPTPAPLRPFLPFLSKLVADKGTSIDQGGPFGAHHLALDIFRPLHAAPRAPVILFLHGGAWIMGNRAEYYFVGTVLAARGFTTIIPDYRKFPKVRFPAFVEDAAAAYRWTAEAFAGAGQNRPIIVMGHSAGAHSAALLALDQRYLAGSPAPAALIGFSGPYAMDAKTQLAKRSIFVGATPADLRPVHFARPDAPPALLVHGKLDMIVRPRSCGRAMPCIWRRPCLRLAARWKQCWCPAWRIWACCWPWPGPCAGARRCWPGCWGFWKSCTKSPRPALPAPARMLCTAETALAPPRATLP